MQKQMNAMVSVPVTKEGKRLEGSLGRNVEKVVKAHTDALWARLQEENAKQEKLERDRTQQITNLISNYVNKDMVSVLEKIIKKEISSIGTTITRSLSQVIEKTISSAITESFQVCICCNPTLTIDMVKVELKSWTILTSCVSF